MADDAPIDEPAATDEPAPDPELGDKGEKALAAFKERARTAEREAKAAKAEHERLTAELDELRAGQMSDREKEVEAARKEERKAVTAELKGEYQARLDASAIEKAAKEFADPSDAILNLDLTTIERNADGSFKEPSLTAALAGVLERKPHLAKSAGPGSVDSGPRGTTVTQITRDALRTMTPDEINKARDAGQLASLLGHQT